MVADPYDADAPGNDRVDEAIAEYLSAAEAGGAPSREEFLHRYPDLAGPLAEFFDDQDRFNRWTGDLRAELGARSVASTAPQASTQGLAPGTPSPGPSGGFRFGDYEIEREIARGGMGVVYSAVQTGLNRRVALKMILSGRLASPADVARFRSEAEAAAQLDHAHIVPLYEIGEHEGQHYFTMRLVEGGDLTGHVARLARDPREAVRLVAAVAEAIHHAHQRGVLHRDLKPRNILLDEAGDPQVTDFGLAKRVDGSRELTQSGAVLGTASYMAPEQARAEKALTTAVDVYSLGAILYELLTGRPPFRGANPTETILQVMEREPPRPRALRPEIDRDLETICLKCLEKEPLRRYGSAEALADDLHRWLARLPITARPVGNLERAVRWCRRNPGPTVVGATLVLLTAFYIGTLTNALHRAETGRLATRAAREEVQDALAASLYEQARALAAAGPPGRRWDILKLAAQAEQLRGRAREAPPHAPADSQSAPTLPEKHQLRSVAVTALLLSDARSDLQLGQEFGGQPALSLDGRWAISTGWKDAERRSTTLMSLWEGRVVRRFDEPKMQGTALAIDASAALLATHDYESGAVTLWDLAEGKRKRTLPWPRPAKPDEVNPARQGFLWSSEMAFSPTGRYLTAIYRRGGRQSLVLWDLAGSGEPQTLVNVAENDSFGAGVFNADETLLVYPTGPQSIGVWDVSTAKKQRDVPLPKPVVGRIALRGSRMVCACAAAERGAGTLLVWDLAAFRAEATLGTDFSLSGASLALHPSADRVAVGTNNGRIFVLDLTSGRTWLALPGAHQQQVVYVRWDPTGHRLVSWGVEGTLKRWEIVGPPLAEQGVGPKAFHCALSSDAARVAIAAEGERTIRILDRSTGKLQRELAERDAPTPGLLLFSPDGRQLAEVDSYQARVWDVATGRLRARCCEATGLRGVIVSVAFSAQGRLFGVIERSADPHLAVWDLERSTAIWQARSGQFMNTAFVTPGAALAVAILPPESQRASSISMIDLAQGEEIARAEAMGAPIGMQPFSPDGRWMIALRRDPGEPFYDLATSFGRARAADVVLHPIPPGTAGQSIPGPSAPSAFAFSADSRLLAIGYRDGWLRLWDLARHEEVLFCPLRSRPIMQLALGGAGDVLAVSEGEGNIQFVDLVQLRRQLAELQLDW